MLFYIQTIIVLASPNDNNPLRPLWQQIQAYFCRPNVESIVKSKLLFFGCFAILDLFLFQETVLLNACFIFSKKLMLLFIDEVATVT